MRPIRLHIHEVPGGWIVTGPRGDNGLPSSVRVCASPLALGRLVTSWAEREDATAVDDAIASIGGGSDVTLVPSETVRIEMNDPREW